MSIKINPIKNTTSPVLKKVKTNKKFVIPTVTVPIVACINPAKIRTRDRNKLIEKEQDHIAHTVTDRTEFNTEQLKRAGIKDSDIERYLKTDGHVTDEGKAILRQNHKSFKGTHTETSEYETGESVGGDYDDILQSNEITELDNTIEAIDKVLDNPFLLGAAAELIPFAKFIQPGVDLAKGNTEKAAIGVVSRGVDILLSPLKLLLATSKGICDGAKGIYLDDDQYGFIKGFTGFYKDWAEGRDEIENEIIGAPSKEEQLKKLEELKQKKLAEREQKIRELQKKQGGLKVNTASQQISLKEKQDKFLLLLLEYNAYKPEVDISAYKNYEEWDVKTLDKKMQELNNIVSDLARKKELYDKQQAILKEKQEKLLDLLVEYNAYKPGTDLSTYKDYEKWDIEKLDKAIRDLNLLTTKLAREKEFDDKQKAILKEKQDKFFELLLEYNAYKHGIGLSEYLDYDKWDIKTLDKKTQVLQSIVTKLAQEY